MIVRRLAVFVAGAVFVLGVGGSALAASDLPPTSVGTAAPDFTLQSLTQARVTLSAYRGSKPVMLFFWTTWCPYCRQELQVLASRYVGLTAKGLAMIIINVGESSARVQSFTDKFKFPFPIYLDSDEKVSIDYDLIGVPTYVLIDKKGVQYLVTHSFPQEEINALLAK